MRAATSGWRSWRRAEAREPRLVETRQRVLERDPGRPARGAAESCGIADRGAIGPMTRRGRPRSQVAVGRIRSSVRATSRPASECRSRRCRRRTGHRDRGVADTRRSRRRRRGSRERRRDCRPAVRVRGGRAPSRRAGARSSMRRRCRSGPARCGSRGARAPRRARLPRTRRRGDRRRPWSARTASAARAARPRRSARGSPSRRRSRPRRPARRANAARGARRRAARGECPDS